MSSHDDEIHIWDGTDWLERTGGGIPCYRTLCDCENIMEQISFFPGQKDVTCTACVLASKRASYQPREEE